MRHWALAATAAVALIVTAGIAVIALSHYGDYADQPPFIPVLVGFIVGQVVTGIAMVWAATLAMRMEQMGWSIALIFGTLVLDFATLGTMPGLLVLVFAIWGSPVAPLESRDSSGGSASVLP
jgi:hypothetical protein